MVFSFDECFGVDVSVIFELKSVTASASKCMDPFPAYNSRNCSVYDGGECRDEPEDDALDDSIGAPVFKCMDP